MPNKPIDHFSPFDAVFLFIIIGLLTLAVVGNYYDNKKETIIIKGLNKLVDPVKGICKYNAVTLDGKTVTIDTTCCMFGFDDTIIVNKKLLK